MSLRRKRLRVLRKGIQKKPKAERERILKEARESPHLCSECCTGKAYFEGRLVCYCWPAEEMRVYEQELKSGVIVLDRKEGDVRHYKRAAA